MVMATDIQVATLTEYDGDGFLGVSVDAVGGAESGLPPAELQHPLGLISRSRDPDVDGEGTPTLGAGVLRLTEGAADHCIALGDPRATPKLPRLEKGGVALYADTGAAVLPFTLLSGLDGSWQLYVPYGSSPATAMTIAVSVTDAGAESIQIVHGAGMRITMAAGGKNSIVLVNKAGDAYVEINDDGVTFNGNAQLVGGLAVGVPSPAGPPPPAPVARAAEIVARETAQDIFNAAVMALLNAPGPVIGAPGAIPVVPPLASTVTATKLSTT